MNITRQRNAIMFKTHSKVGRNIEFPGAVGYVTWRGRRLNTFDFGDNIFLTQPSQYVESEGKTFIIYIKAADVPHSLTTLTYLGEMVSRFKRYANGW